MKSMEVHFGVIRDKNSIHAGLLHSRSSNHQLAICFNSEGKLLVRICTVTDLVVENDVVSVVLQPQPGNRQSEFRIPLDRIQSIYPIREFNEEGDHEHPVDKKS